MTWLQIASTLFSIVWLIGLLIVLWRIMRASERNAHSNGEIASTLIGTSESNAQSAKIAAQAAQEAIVLLKEERHAV